MARQETARIVRAQIDVLRKEREALIGRRQRLDSEIASVDADIRKLEAVLQPSDGSTHRGRTVSSLASGTADLVCELLAEADTPLHYRTIYERLRDREPRLPQSDDPATALLARYFNDHRLYRTAPGTYALRQPAPPISTSASEARKGSDLTGKRPIGFTLENTHYEAHSFKGVLISVCTTLHDLDPAVFRRVLTAEATHRSFSEDHRPRRNGGSLRAPGAIADSGIFVETNRSAGTVESLCRKVIALVGLDASEFSIEVE